MSLLQDRTNMSARVSRATSNALKVDLQVQDGVVAAQARQKGSAAVLFGFKNGGKASYTVTSKGMQLDLAVGPTTTVTRNGSPLGSVVGAGTSARIEDAGGTVLATINPFSGAKSDAAYVHLLTSPHGATLGSLTFMRTGDGWNTITDILNWVSMIDFVGSALKAPSFGALLRLDAPVDDVLGDLLAAALVDMSVLPRAYLA